MARASLKRTMTIPRTISIVAALNIAIFLSHATSVVLRGHVDEEVPVYDPTMLHQFRFALASQVEYLNKMTVQVQNCREGTCLIEGCFRLHEAIRSASLAMTNQAGIDRSPPDFKALWQPVLRAWGRGRVTLRSECRGYLSTAED